MAEKEEVKEREHSTPDWLKTIQLNSWEAELLVSALVLYALFQVPDFIHDFHLRSFDRGSQFHRFFNILIMAVELLKFGYIFHILVRGLWVASVGLSYVFPKGIDKELLKFKGRFDTELNAKSSLVNSVLRLEELSSLFYGISFLAFGVLLGVGTLFFTFVLLSEVMTTAIQNGSPLAALYFFAYFIYLILMVLVFIDFLTNGLFRRIDWMAKWFYPVAIFFRVITLSFLYRRSMLVLVSNTKGWKSYLIPFFVLVVCGGFAFLRGEVKDGKKVKYLAAAQEVNIMNDNYENLRDNEDLVIATIQSDIITENALQIFIDDLGVYKSFYREDTAKSKTKWDYLGSDTSSLFLNKWLSFHIDSAEYENIKWFKTQHRSALDFGFLTYIDINTLARGSHNLSIRVDTTQLGDGARRTVREGMYHQLDLSNIHFFYDKQ
ncbi:MAG: hypothetical protein ABJG78_21730 [Cyclobacteriaceae bacterium]